MPDWAIVLIAAFGGGLAGAVLQPVASHVLERVRREEETRKRRERSLRRMMRSTMADGRRRLVLAFEVESRAGMGRPLTPLEVAERLVEKGEQLASQGVLWEPERIEDERLRSLAVEYNDAARGLTRILAGEPYEVERGRPLGERLEELQTQITLQMDELNWPEVDD